MSTRATNPTNSGSMLLDRSTAKPGSIDKAVFGKKAGPRRVLRSDKGPSIPTT